MTTPMYPVNRAEANEILRAVSAGVGGHFPAHLIRYCLLMTGDLS